VTWPLRSVFDLLWVLQELVERESAENAIAKLHNQDFMGTTLRVELSTGDKRHSTSGPTGQDRRFARNTCFICGEQGHWAKECPK
jgi:hypothetical protein